MVKTVKLQGELKVGKQYLYIYAEETIDGKERWKEITCVRVFDGFNTIDITKLLLELGIEDKLLTYCKEV